MNGLFIFLLGLSVGSFINVCIWRMPKKKSIAYPFSYCPKCGNRLRWHENIPLLSYLFLQGRCHYCKKNISFRYPLIELMSGLIFLFLYFKYSLGVQLLALLILIVFLLIASGIDFYHRLIPNRITYPLILIGLSFSFFNSFLDFPASRFGFPPQRLPLIRFFYSFSSLLIAAGTLYLIGIIGERIFKKEAMGGGDVKLLAGIGTFVGIRNIFWIIFFASAIGGTVGLLRIFYLKYLKIDNRCKNNFQFSDQYTSSLKSWNQNNSNLLSEEDMLIPFAPYLSIATLITLLFLTN